MVISRILGKRRMDVYQDCLIISEAPPPYLWASMALNMLQKRASAACIGIHQGSTLWIVGGEDGDFAHNTSEFLTLSDIPLPGQCYQQNMLFCRDAV